MAVPAASCRAPGPPPLRARPPRNLGGFGDCLWKGTDRQVEAAQGVGIHPQQLAGGFGAVCGCWHDGRGPLLLQIVCLGGGGWGAPGGARSGMGCAPAARASSLGSRASSSSPGSPQKAPSRPSYACVKRHQNDVWLRWPQLMVATILTCAARIPSCPGQLRSSSAAKAGKEFGAVAWFRWLCASSLENCWEAAAWTRSLV